ncbi:MAG: hypothetical protein IJ629_00230 [Clostridia bacterium]|nr:hypothetical protein [Clostridia bacterium]
MENASKALIIAGAILLSILIIALGIYVFNMAKNASSTSSLDELEVSQFNQAFTNYRGKQLGSGVIDLLDKVVANASANKDSDERLPDVVYIDTRTGGAAKGKNTVSGSADCDNPAKNAINAAGFTASGATQWMVKSDSTTPNITAIGAMRRIMAEKHYYQVEFVNNDATGLIEYILVKY